MTPSNPVSEPRLDDEGPLHHHSDAAGTAVPCRTLHRPSNPASGTNEAAERLRSALAALSRLDEVAPTLWQQQPRRNLPMEPMQIPIREWVKTIQTALATERAIGAGIDGLRLLRSDPTLQHECYHGGLDSEGLPSFHVVIDVAILDDLIATLASETPRPEEPTPVSEDEEFGEPFPRSQPGGSDAE